jgi:hypothetical protein
MEIATHAHQQGPAIKERRGDNQVTSQFTTTEDQNNVDGTIINMIMMPGRRPRSRFSFIGVG